MIGPFVSLTVMGKRTTMGGDKEQDSRILIPVHLLGPIKELDQGCSVVIANRSNEIMVNEGFDEIVKILGGERNGMDV